MLHQSTSDGWRRLLLVAAWSVLVLLLRIDRQHCCHGDVGSAGGRELSIWAAAKQLQDGAGQQQAHAQLVQLAHSCWRH